MQAESARRGYLFNPCSFGQKERLFFLGGLFLRSTTLRKPHTILSKLFFFFSFKIYPDHLRVQDYSQQQQNVAAHIKFASTSGEDTIHISQRYCYLPNIWIVYPVHRWSKPQNTIPCGILGWHSPGMEGNSAFQGLLQLKLGLGFVSANPTGSHPKR